MSSAYSDDAGVFYIGGLMRTSEWLVVDVVGDSTN
jgi:hypothetical protein